MAGRLRLQAGRNIRDNHAGHFRTSTSRRLLPRMSRRFAMSDGGDQMT
jgi:hypothetical protein